MSPPWEKSPFCIDCWNDIQPMPKHLCTRCGLPVEALKEYQNGDQNVDESLLLCHECLNTSPFFDQARAAARYSKKNPLRNALLALKHAKNLSTVKPLALLLRDGFLRHMSLDPDEIVVPVPLHWKRFLERGFNQAGLLAQQFARLMDLEVSNNIIIRAKHTPTQSGNPENRQKNVRKAFSIKNGKKLNGCKILLIDDVMTTGATINACAHILKDNGCDSVRALTVARVIL